MESDSGWEHVKCADLGHICVEKGSLYAEQCLLDRDRPREVKHDEHLTSVRQMPVAVDVMVSTRPT
jgi:hypothetical protein